MQNNFNVVRTCDQHLLHAANAFKASVSATCTALHSAALSVTALFMTPIIHVHSTLNNSTAEHFHLDTSLLYLKDEFNLKLPY